MKPQRIVNTCPLSLLQKLIQWKTLLKSELEKNLQLWIASFGSHTQLSISTPGTTHLPPLTLHLSAYTRLSISTPGTSHFPPWLSISQLTLDSPFQLQASLISHIWFSISTPGISHFPPLTLISQLTLISPSQLQAPPMTLHLSAHTRLSFSAPGTSHLPPLTLHLLAHTLETPNFYSHLSISWLRVVVLMKNCKNAK